METNSKPPNAGSHIKTILHKQHQGYLAVLSSLRVDLRLRVARHKLVDLCQVEGCIP